MSEPCKNDKERERLRERLMAGETIFMEPGEDALDSAHAKTTTIREVDSGGLGMDCGHIHSALARAGFGRWGWSHDLPR